MKHQITGRTSSSSRDMELVPARGISTWIDKVNPYDPDRLKSGSYPDLEPVRIEELRIKSSAARVVFIAFIAFSLWAFFAPLDAGVHVAGSVVVMGNRKAVQHPTGGVVEELLVREGDNVKRGDTLIRINRLGTDADLNAAELDFINVAAAESRLLSERDNAPEIVWLPQLDKLAADPRVIEAKRQQTRIFKSRKDELAGRLRILDEKLAGLKAQAYQLGKVIAARDHQLNVMAVEVKKNDELAAKGFVSRSRVSEIERLRSDAVANAATTRFEQGKANSDIAATRLEMTQTMAVYHSELETQLADSQKIRKTLSAKVDSLKFNLSLTELRAPVAGTVVGLKANTVGGVIQSGEVLMEIVPNEGALIIEAHVPPALIDKVTTGLAADMRFTAFNHTTTPVIPGTVRMVGADLLKVGSRDQSEEYYLAQIETADKGKELLGDRRLQPGMPVDVVIKTGQRTFVSYLMKPLTDRFATSFKED
jgi:membrane fusion protein, protease secretion system